MAFGWYGKTCTAVSLKSFLYEKLDYSVIWVTRKTLKEDVWKNMYDNICDHIIRSKYKNNDQRETLKKYLSKNSFLQCLINNSQICSTIRMTYMIV